MFWNQKRLIIAQLWNKQHNEINNIIKHNTIKIKPHVLLLMIDLNKLKLLTGSFTFSPIKVENSLILSFTTPYLTPCLCKIISTKLSCMVAQRVSWNGRCTQQAQNSNISCSERVNLVLCERKLVLMRDTLSGRWKPDKGPRICRRGTPKRLILRAVEGSCWTWNMRRGYHNQ